MLKSLSISNYALIDSLDISFPGNLVIITGETGAGKSILLGALSLLLGSKADVSHLGDKSRNCVVEAEFEVEGEFTLLRRVISPQGRSRSFINDEPVTMDQLRETSSHLVDIHSQHQHLLLTDRNFQITVLDGFAGLNGEVAQYARHYDEHTALEKELSSLEQRIAASERERDYIEYQIARIDEAKPVEGEIEELEAEQRRLANSEFISSQIARAMSVFDPEGESTDSNMGGSLDSMLKEIEASLGRISQFIPQSAQLSERVSRARIELKDIACELSETRNGTDTSPERLQIVDDRLSLLYDLMRKYNVQTESELISIRNQFASSLKNCRDDERRREDIITELNSLTELCRKEAEEIHRKRSVAVGSLSSEIEKSVRLLDMPLACFRVSVTPSDKLDRRGMDIISFEFSANGEGRLEEISKCASGGELSRVMLCIKDLMSRYMGMPTMIFDEIDTGVSGSMAHRMGRMIVDMGKNMQVFAITHLPQVASKGNAHYKVYKEKDGSGKVVSRIREITGEERVNEIARMLSGENLTPEAISNAKVLLNEK